jgi:hypothetical protein
MTSYKNELTIDFGEVSYLGSRGGISCATGLQSVIRPDS